MTEPVFMPLSEDAPDREVSFYLTFQISLLKLLTWIFQIQTKVLRLFLTQTGRNMVVLRKNQKQNTALKRMDILFKWLHSPDSVIKLICNFLAAGFSCRFFLHDNSHKQSNSFCCRHSCPDSVYSHNNGKEIHKNSGKKHTAA